MGFLTVKNMDFNLNKNHGVIVKFEQFCYYQDYTTVPQKITFHTIALDNLYWFCMSHKKHMHNVSCERSQTMSVSIFNSQF